MCAAQSRAGARYVAEFFNCAIDNGGYRFAKGGHVRKGNVDVDVTVIPALVDQGLSDLEIASRMGWKVSTLRVRCSQLKISLRRRFKQVVVPKPLLNQLHQRAALMGISANTLVVDLLEEIARDNLYDAVLDKRDTEEVFAPASHAMM